jgi:hypothetical protein
VNLTTQIKTKFAIENDPIMNPILDSQFMEFMDRLMPAIDLEAWTHFNQEQ